MRIATAAVLLVMSCLAGFARADGALSGVWKIALVPDDATRLAGEEGFADKIMFEETVFTAEACSMYGFAPCGYNAGDQGHFDVAMVSDRHGQMAWSGAAQNGVVIGQLTWTKDDGSVRIFTFSGARVVELEDTGD